LVWTLIFPQLDKVAQLKDHSFSVKIKTVCILHHIHIPSKLPPMWYPIKNPEEIDSPALLIYPERAKKNIQTAIQVAGDVNRLRPHVKTHKMVEIAQMQLEAGITKFKCATIAEAEMLAIAQAKDILLSYQPIGPRADRLLALAQAYPEISFGCLLDDPNVAYQLSIKAKETPITLKIWLDIDNGMQRSGIAPGDGALALYGTIADLPGLEAAGLHVYDGHIRNPDFQKRIVDGDHAFTAVYTLIDRIEAAGLGKPNVVVGGSPSFPVNSLRANVDLSPGTFIFWDISYANLCPELDFDFAAVVLTRILSKLGGKRICLDVGSKGVSPDHRVEDRIRFLNLETQPTFIGQSEEHLVIEVDNPDDYAVGDVWYGVPFHVCPTVNLYQEAWLVPADQNSDVSESWEVVARNRKISF
jgi:D-serine deaminase-like pyridoxal phosphate-dependent protein